jgi:uncharacterized protein YdeI (YjbR/CyaY-like superfamily)
MSSLSQREDRPRADSVDAYFEKLSPFARPICAALRRLVKAAGPGLSETLRWGAPCYVGRSLVCGIWAFQKHVSLQFFRGAELSDEEHQFTHGRENASSRSIKFKSVEALRPAKLEKLLQAAVARDRQPAARAGGRPRRAPLPVPAALAAALKSSRRAAARFESLAPSHRREYLDWVIEAKRPETQARRVAQVIEHLEAAARSG